MLSVRTIACIGALFAFAVFRIFYSSTITSLVLLQINYFGRPYSTFPKDYKHERIVANAAWNGTYLHKHPELWIDILNFDDQLSLTFAVKYFTSLNKTLEKMSTKDFPISDKLKADIERWKLELAKGLGFRVIRGIPVQNWTIQECNVFYFALGQYLGTPGAQDINGSLLHHVRDVGATKEFVRPYQRREEIKYHCDTADIVALLCLHPAKNGGASRIISSVSVYNELLKKPEGQAYANRLLSKVFLVPNNHFGKKENIKAAYLLRKDSDGTLRTFWAQDYVLNAYEDKNGTITARGRDEPIIRGAIKAYDSILAEDIRAGEKGDDEADQLGLSMFLRQGDVQLVSNHFILHSRMEFEDFSDEEIAAQTIGNDGKIASIGKRDLLRLWLKQTNEHLTYSLIASKYANMGIVAIDAVKSKLGLFGS
jgi:hypothetical protein